MIDTHRLEYSRYKFTLILNEVLEGNLREKRILSIGDYTEKLLDAELCNSVQGEVMQLSIDTLLIECVIPNGLKGQRFDAIIWLDSAHCLSISERSLVLNLLCEMSEIILFASAPPLDFSTSELTSYLWPDQWKELFQRFSFSLVDKYRTQLCRLPLMDPVLAQNLLLFVSRRFVELKPRFLIDSEVGGKRLVHYSKLCNHCPTGCFLSASDSEWTIASYIWRRWQLLKPRRSTISAVITFHNEELIAQRTLNGLVRMCDHAACQDIDVEVICVLDNASELTQEVVRRHPLVLRQGRVVSTCFGDPGDARNVGIDVAGGDYIGILDGDDLYSANWLTAALKRCQEFELPVIVHNHQILSFGADWNYRETPDHLSLGFAKFSPPIENLWFAASFGPRLVYQLVPYVRADVRQSGYGFEDWHWNCETFAGGIPHTTAANTALFYRRNQASRVTADNSLKAVIRPTAYFRNPKLCDLHTLVIQSEPKPCFL